MHNLLSAYERKRESVKCVLVKYEGIKCDAQRSGLNFKAPSKLAFQREADVGKTYINRLEKDDPLYLRFEALREKPEERVIRKNIEQERLDEIRRVKADLEVTTLEKQKLSSEISSLQLELKRVRSQLEKYEAAWHAKGQVAPKLTVFDGDDCRVVELPIND
ncbi:hypothetical protein [Aliiroseovarius sp. 2305UL8-7]|uniref:hypothetical protein n=1 Tax=Aliiroseovarius conchicola TaxID=3121637 RepID=UPI003527E296